MLRKLQNSFLSSLNHADLHFLNHIRPHSKVMPAIQFSIYQNSIVARFQRALKDIYPVCQQLVGDDFFFALTNHYIAATQSTSTDLNDYGADFADFIDNYPPAATLPYLGDVARLEWGWHRIAAAPDQASFDFTKLAACYREAGEALVFTLPPRCTLLTSSYPVHKIWETNQKDYSGNDTITLQEDEHYFFLIWRDHYELRIDNLNELQWQLLDMIKNGLSLGAICEAAVNIEETLDIPTLFSEWVHCGWIADTLISINPVAVTTIL